jgi:hypothetical protein
MSVVASTQVTSHVQDLAKAVLNGVADFSWPLPRSKKKGHDAPYLLDTVSLRGLNPSPDVLSCPQSLQPD